MRKKDPFSLDVPKNHKISIGQRKSEWVEDSYIAGPGGNSYVSSNFDIKRLRILFLFIIVLFAITFVKTGYLQIVQGNLYRLAAEENRIRIKELKAPRGIIYDRNGESLAYNVPNFILTVTPGDLPEDPMQRSEIIQSIADILTIDSSALSKSIGSDPKKLYEPIVLADHIPYDKAVILRIASANQPGISLEANYFREYVNDFALSHLLGYMGKVTDEDLETHPDYSYDDYIGKTGVEFYYDQALHGVHGKKEIEVDSLGKESVVVTESQPIAGKNLTLTVDLGLQRVLGEAAQAAVDNSRQITGVAVVAINPRNGEILALVSIPAYDSNALTLGLTDEAYTKLREDPANPFVNRTVSGEYPSGSTIKPLIALAGLEERLIDEHSTILSTGGIQVDKWFFPDWKQGGHGQTDVKRAIAESINTFFYAIGGGYEAQEGLGLDKIKTYLELFGLNAPLGIDLPGETSGFLPTREWKEETKGEPWYIGDTYHLAIGQGDLLVTPLQVASYTATIANGGTFYRPHLLKNFSDPYGNVTDIPAAEIINDGFIGGESYRIVREGLRQAVVSGSAVALSTQAVEIAAKTGTAQFGAEGKTHAWFTSFAPFENPEIAITVLVEAGGEGHNTALPIARAGYEYLYPHEPAE
ncbi:MAG: penicillin-binding protein 2 [Patescibacteria group bacterium]